MEVRDKDRYVTHTVGFIDVVECPVEGLGK